MDIPDVTAFTLADAKQILQKAGIVIGQIKVAFPPREAELEAEDYFRVLKVEQADIHRVELIVCKPL